jgi:hypothetical protein
MLRKLLVGAFVVGVSFTLASFLCLTAGSPAWAQVERKNCPADFHWERMSGQCCVQDYETIPENGRIGYTGNSICPEGFSGTYEQRPTTDGQGPPGCPGYTSFAFLTSCVSSTSGTSGGDAGISIRDLSEAVFHGGSGPSTKDLAAVGGLSTGVLVLSSGAVVVLRRRPVPLEKLVERLQARPEPGEVERAWREWRAALEQFEPIRQKWDALGQRREQLVKDWVQLRDAIRELEGRTGLTGRYSITQVLGLVVGLLGGLLPVGWPIWAARILGGGMSLGAGLLKGDQQGVKAVLAQAWAKVDSQITDVDNEKEQFKRVYEIGENRVKDTFGRYESLRQSRGY